MFDDVRIDGTRLTLLTLRVIDAAEFPNIIQEIFQHADLDAVRVLSRVNRSLRAAACRRLWPLQHFDLKVVAAPYYDRRLDNDRHLYELRGEGVRVLAEAENFDWCSAGEEFHEAVGRRSQQARSPLLVPDGRVKSLDEIPLADRERLRGACVLDIDQLELNRAELFMVEHFMPSLHTVRFPGIDNHGAETVHFPRASRFVFLDDWAEHARLMPPGYPAKRKPVSKFLFCAADATKVVINQAHGVNFLETKRTPMPRSTGKLKEISYIFKHWDASTIENESESLELFVRLAVWAAGNGVKVTVVGADELDGSLIVQRCKKTVTGKGKRRKYEEHLITGAVIVRSLKEELAKFAAQAEAEPLTGMPENWVAEKVERNVTFVTRDQYRDTIGLEDFKIETEQHYYNSQALRPVPL